MINLIFLALLILSLVSLYVTRQIPTRNNVLAPEWLKLLIIATLVIVLALGVYIFVHMLEGDLTAFPLIALLIDMAFETYFVVRVWKGIW